MAPDDVLQAVVLQEPPGDIRTKLAPYPPLTGRPAIRGAIDYFVRFNWSWACYNHKFQLLFNSMARLTYWNTFHVVWKIACSLKNSLEDCM